VKRINRICHTRRFYFLIPGDSCLDLRHYEARGMPKWTSKPIG
jgi:hypothetical protein